MISEHRKEIIELIEEYNYWKRGVDSGVIVLTLEQPARIEANTRGILED